MTTTYETDPNTQTIAAAWASSALGQPDGEVRDGFDESEPVAEAPRSVAKHAMLAFALGGGIAAGVAAALMFVDGMPADQTVVVPSTTSPQHAVVVTPSSPASSPATIAPVQETAPTFAPAPANVPHLPGVSTAPAPTTVVDVPTQGNPAPTDEPQNNYPVPPNPEDPTPEPPKPHIPPVPPGLDDLKLPEPPKPTPPLFDPDLPLAPKPQPAPTPDPSDFIPDLELTS